MMNEYGKITRMEINASRFFADKRQIEADIIIIYGDDARHIKSALRKTAGDRITVCDGAGTDYSCELIQINENEIRARILNSFPCAGEPPVKVTLYQALPRSDKFEYVIQKCVEGGVYEIAPVISAHTQFTDRLKGESGGRRLARWRRISYEAAKQSGRGIVPEISDPVSFSDAADACARFIGKSPDDRLALIPYENEAKTSLKSALTTFKRRIAASGADANPHICIFIGPEGGFSPDEIAQCRQNRIAPVTLGPRIYRTESAGFAVLCQIMYEFES